jgi:hypothetical protein
MQKILLDCEAYSVNFVNFGWAQSTKLGETPEPCYTVPADVEICDGLRNLRSAFAAGSRQRTRRLSDDDFLSLDDTTHYPSLHVAAGQLIVLERNIL